MVVAQVDLVLTDMMMPVMDGAKLATAMRRLRRPIEPVPSGALCLQYPAKNVVFCS